MQTSKDKVNSRKNNVMKTVIQQFKAVIGCYIYLQRNVGGTQASSSWLVRLEVVRGHLVVLHE